VSPQNILVGADGIARVVDFGVAKAAGRLQSTSEGQVKGKAGYMAPEQLAGSVDSRCDIYAASVVLWELLTGRHLFVGESHAEVIAKVLAADVPSPRSLAPNVPEALDEIVMCGLDSVPDRRFATAREMERAIKRAVPIASAFDVAEWLETIVGESLRARADLIARVERESRGGIPTGSAPARAVNAGGDARATTDAVTIRTGSAPHRARLRAALIVAVLLLGVGVMVLFGTRIRTASSSSSSPSSSRAVPPVSAPPNSGGDTVIATGPASSAAASTPTTALLPTHTTPSLPGPVPAPPRPRVAKPSCSPPYRVDSEGHKHFLVECL
jgi:serine/threonine-protein kinase